eukprot:6104245-Pyramimonas_sp.AAC.1
MERIEMRTTLCTWSKRVFREASPVDSTPPLLRTTGSLHLPPPEHSPAFHLLRAPVHRRRAWM